MAEQKKLLVTILMIGVVLLGLFVLLYFQLSSYGWGPMKGDESLTTQIDSLKTKLAKEKARIKKIPDVEQQRRELEVDYQVAMQLLPKESSPDELLGFINEKARTAGADIIAIKPSRPAIVIEDTSASTKKKRTTTKSKKGGSTEKMYEEWTFDMKLLGTYDQLGSFINKMEEFEIEVPGGVEKRFFAVKAISLKADSGGLTEDGRHACSLVMQTFRYLKKEG